MPRKYPGYRYFCQDKVEETREKDGSTKYTLVREGCGRTQIHQGACVFCGNQTEIRYE